MIPLRKLGSKKPSTQQTMPDSDSENEGLLTRDQEDSRPIREARNSIEGMVDDLDEIDEETYLDEEDPLYEDPYPKKNATLAYDATSSKHLSGIRRLFHRRAKCISLFLILSICIWVVLGLGSWWVLKMPAKNGLSPAWYPTPLGGTVKEWEDSYAKAAKMVEKMSLVSKVNITTGTGWQMGLAVGNTGPASDVGFPGLALQDGPLGIRFADRATAFPAGVTVGATWNRTLFYLRGKAHGAEAKGKGINILLGPCVGPLGRMPAGGRNWEGFGADPYLQGVAAAETIRGIQSEKVIATIKHYIGNEQEHFRQGLEWILPNALSSNIGDRTLHELYLWPFADAVRAGVGSVMCSYQMTNNSYSCQNSKLLNGILKDELGFQGFVQSDWLAQRGGVASALAGLDMSMPGDGIMWAGGKSLWGSEMTKAVLNGSLPLTRLNDMVTRVVAAWYQLGQDDETVFDRKGPNFSSWTNDKMGLINAGSSDDHDMVEVNKFVDVQGEGDDAHSKIARRVAAEGTVLVKNLGNILPISHNGGIPEKGQMKFRVGVFGEDAGDGGMSGFPNGCQDRACNQGTLGSGWGSGAVEFPYLITPESALRAAFNDTKTVKFTSFPNNTPPGLKSPEVLRDQDLCLVFVNADSGEGYLSWESTRGDRNDLNIQKKGDELVLQVAEACGAGRGKTIVVVHNVGPVILEKWIDHPGVHAVLIANLPGQESGNALVDILFGIINPSGKLPYTISKTLDDFGEAGKIKYLPDTMREVTGPQQNFSEGIHIDYRHFDKYDITPRFEFGFGLSYTTFIYSNLKVKSVKPKSRLPDPRPSPVSAPSYQTDIPDASSALFPSNFRKLKKFIYPYISSVEEIHHGPYPYPEGYHEEQSPSQAGGGQGGNPSLFDTHYTISVTLNNTGSVAGAEVAQLYLSYPGSPQPAPPGPDNPLPTKSEFRYDENMDEFPVKVLRGFEKVQLAAGESKDVEFTLTRRDLSFWHTGEQNWVMPVDGKFIVRVGTSSRNLQLSGEF